MQYKAPYMTTIQYMDTRCVVLGPHTTIQYMAITNLYMGPKHLKRTWTSHIYTVQCSIQPYSIWLPQIYTIHGILYQYVLTFIYTAYNPPPHLYVKRTSYIHGLHAAITHAWTPYHHTLHGLHPFGKLIPSIYTVQGPIHQYST